jgi:hypothetical protein
MWGRSSHHAPSRAPDKATFSLNANHLRPLSPSAAFPGGECAGPKELAAEPHSRPQTSRSVTPRGSDAGRGGVSCLTLGLPSRLRAPELSFTLERGKRTRSCPAAPGEQGLLLQFYQAAAGRGRRCAPVSLPPRPRPIPCQPCASLNV